MVVISLAQKSRKHVSDEMKTDVGRKNSVGTPFSGHGADRATGRGESDGRRWVRPAARRRMKTPS